VKVEYVENPKALSKEIGTWVPVPATVAIGVAYQNWPSILSLYDSGSEALSWAKRFELANVSKSAIAITQRNRIDEYLLV
jgi:hypothetical protein